MVETNTLGFHSHQNLEYKFPTCTPKPCNQDAVFIGYTIKIESFSSVSIKPVPKRFMIVTGLTVLAGFQINFLCIIANWATEILRLLAQIKKQ